MLFQKTARSDGDDGKDLAGKRKKRRQSAPAKPLGKKEGLMKGIEGSPFGTIEEEINSEGR
jgi:hypothetical protein